MSQPRVTTLDRLVRLKRGYDLPAPKRRPGTIPILGSFGITGWHDEAKNSGPGVTIGRSGASIGVATYHDGPFWPLNTALYAHDFLGNDPRYVYYLLKSIDFARYNSGSAQPSLNRNYLEQISVVDFNVSEQRRIVEVLGSIDDLIVNNKRRVEVMEEMVRTIYREWFAKFRYPGHEDVSLVDSDVGPIPEGWEVKTVAEVSAVVTRGISPKYTAHGSWVVLNQKCIRNERVSFRSSRQQERLVGDAKRARHGDVLINSTGVGTLGRVALYRGLMGNVTVDSHVTIARPRDESLNPWYGICLISKQPEFERLGTGSTGQTELRRGDIGAAQVVLPSAAALAAFGSVAWPLLGEADALLAMNDSIADLRDLLLPKLVTGRIDVSELDLDGLLEDGVVG